MKGPHVLALGAMAAGVSAYTNGPYGPGQAQDVAHVGNPSMPHQGGLPHVSGHGHGPGMPGHPQPQANQMPASIFVTQSGPPPSGKPITRDQDNDASGFWSRIWNSQMPTKFVLGGAGAVTAAHAVKAADRTIADARYGKRKRREGRPHGGPNGLHVPDGGSFPRPKDYGHTPLESAQRAAFQKLSQVGKAVSNTVQAPFRSPVYTTPLNRQPQPYGPGAAGNQSSNVASGKPLYASIRGHSGPSHKQTKYQTTVEEAKP